MIMCLYYYKIKIYNDIDHKEEKEDGYTVGENYADALNRLMDFYGEDETLTVTLKYITDRPILILPTKGAITEKGLVEAIADNNNF